MYVRFNIGGKVKKTSLSAPQLQSPMLL